MRKSAVKAFLGASLCCVSALAFSQPYIHGSIGQADVDGADDKDTSFEVGGGYRFTENFSVEASYLALGTFGASGPVSDPDSGEVFNFDTEAEFDGFNFLLVAALPVSEQVELFAKLGYLFWDAELSATTDGFSGSASDEGEDVTYGLGAAFKLNEQFAVTAEYREADIGEFESKNFSIGAKFTF